MLGPIRTVAVAIAAALMFVAPDAAGQDVAGPPLPENDPAAGVASRLATLIDLSLT